MAKIKELPISERPREKALLFGIESLTNIELIAILISSGTKNNSAIEIASNLISKVNGIHNFKNLTFNELISVNGINKIKALYLLSIIELIKRTELKLERVKVNENYLVNYFFYKYKNEQQESSYLVLLDKNNNLIYLNSLFKGSESSLAISSKIILSYILKYNASKYYLIHNHPSGDSSPSEADIITTNSLEFITLSVSCQFVDHLIFGKNDYYSLRKNKKIEFKKSES